MREKNPIPNVCMLLCGFLLLCACDDSFQPLQKNDTYHFSIYGTLDAAADTQWVRVGTIRHSIDEPPNSEGIRVTLEDLQSGETVVMNDSLFISRDVLNYWTTMDIENEQTYRITVESAYGKASRITVTTPAELPPIYITINDEPPVGYDIFIDDGVENIVDLQSVWYVILNPGTEESEKKIYRFPLRNTLMHTYAFYGAYYAFANWEEQLEQIEQNVIGDSEISVVTQQFFVAIGGPEWDDSLSSIDDLEYFLDETGSNVENGLGYVVGISSGWFRQRTCLTSNESNYAPCEPEKPFW